MNFIINHLRLAILMGLLPGIFTLYGCAHQKPQPSASLYRFKYNDQAYRIRSISSVDRTESYNELIGEKFVATDFDQDRILDRIILGEASLAEAQKIYEYGLERLAQESKLVVRIPSVNRYVYESNDFQIEIRSFRPTEAPPFNEFMITDNRPLVRPEVIIIVDHNADGTLDEVLKGTVTLEKAQSQYAEAIETGLQKGELIKINHAILVKEK